jgi:DNA invertase Pin-like site-specific DNA recombinase
MDMDLGLARVSSLDQDPTIQLHDLEQAGCWPIISEKVSGVAAKRPVRDEALAQLKTGDTLTCWKLDRLGRSMAEVVSFGSAASLNTSTRPAPPACSSSSSWPPSPSSSVR